MQCGLRLFFYGRCYNNIVFECRKLLESKSFEMGRPRTYRGSSSSSVGWLRGALVCDNSLSPNSVHNLIVGVSWKSIHPLRIVGSQKLSL